MNSAGRRLFAAAAAIVLLAAVRQVLLEEDGIAGIVVSALLIGVAVFVLTFVLRPQSALFVNDQHNQQPADSTLEPEVIDLTARPAAESPVAEVQPPASAEKATPEAITPEAI